MTSSTHLDLRTATRPNHPASNRDLRETMDDELTIDEASEALNVRPSFVAEVIEAGILQRHGTGADACLDKAEVLAFRQRSDTAASAALDEMTADGEAAGLYDE